MRKILVLMLAFMLIGATTYAQNALEVKPQVEILLGIGDMTLGDMDDLNYSNEYETSELKFTPLFSYALGIHGVAALNETTDVSIGFRFSHFAVNEKYTWTSNYDDYDYKSANSYSDEINAKWGFNYIGVPIIVIGKPGWQIAGKDLKLGLGVEPAVNIMAEVEDEDIKEYVKDFNIFLEGIVAVELTPQVDLGLDFRYGALNTFTEIDGQHLMMGSIRTTYKF